MIAENQLPKLPNWQPTQYAPKGSKASLCSEHGFTTLDFVFAMMITFGFTTIFFAVTLTLSMVEVTQYLAFSASRAYAAAHLNRDAQVNLGKQKYSELVSNGIMKRMYATGWFTIPKADEGPLFGSFDSEYPSQSAETDSETFTGARVDFKANILNLRLPFLGNTAESSNTGRASINSYLAREVTTQECIDNFNRQRFAKIKEVYQIPGGTSDDKVYKLITDNGC